jgi:hypothetical protein
VRVEGGVESADDPCGRLGGEGGVKCARARIKRGEVAALQRDAVPANLPDTAPLGALARALALDHSRAAAEPVEA